MMIRQWFEDFKKNLMLMALLYVVLGVVLIIWPDVTNVVLSYIAGGALALAGIIRLIRYFVSDVQLGQLRYDFVGGAALLGAGVFVLMRPSALIAVFPTLLGLAVVLGGALKLQQAIDLYRAAYRYWWVILLIAAGAVVFGVVLLLNPFTVASTLVMLLGVAFLYNGLADFWVVSRISAQVKRIKQREEEKLPFERK